VSTLAILLLLILGIGLTVFRPLQAARHDRPLGPGFEGDDAAFVPRDSSESSAEGREAAAIRREMQIGDADSQVETAPIDPVRRRSGLSPAPASSSSAEMSAAPRTYPGAVAAGWAGLLLAGLAVAFAVERLDLDLRGRFSPEGLPAEGSTEPTPSEAKALEARFLDGEAVEADIGRLLRTYAALGRGQDLEGILRQAVGRHPENPVLQLALGAVLFEAGGAGQVEAESWIDRVLAQEPENLAAGIYKALALQQRGEMEAAAARLRNMKAEASNLPAVGPMLDAILREMESVDESSRPPPETK